jgi:ornithine cyclodeaminase
VVEGAFMALRGGDSENALKTIVQPQDQRSIGYSMVGREGASKTVGFKVVYEFDPHRNNDAYRFHSFVFLCDDVTGAPIGLMDVVKLGPLRTSATSALLARAAQPDGKTALVVGTGAQGQIALPMLLAALPNLERLIVYGHYADGLRAVQSAVKRLYPDREVDVAADLKQAASEADIVLGVSGVSAKAQVRRAWLKPGCVAVLVGYGVDADVLHGADYRIATDIAQMKVTSGDLVAADGSIPCVDAELPDILQGTVAARRDERDVVFAYNSGMVVTDIALGRYLADLALKKGRGERVKLW